ncbi:MAG: hypothetical protein FWC51_01390 [Proteobacteria bacterium]|nr:hypothetical protein [Pseudomonadota bacterium]
MTQITKLKKAKTFGFWRSVAVLIAMTFPVALHSAGILGGGGKSANNANANANAAPTISQVVYQETPVQSYFAYPQDVNFMPEGQFMQRADSLDYDNNIQARRAAESAANPGVQINFADRPVVVCRNFGCTKLNDRVTRTFLFNSLANLFMLNAHSRMYICEADPFTRACLASGISFPARVGVANAMIKMPRATIDLVSLSTGLSRASVGMTFEMLVNGVGVLCEPTTTDIVVPINSQSTLVAREFACNLTTDGYTNLSLIFNIDYIDLDFGILGGYYSLGMQGPTMGGGTGYALFRVEYTNAGLKLQSVATGGGGMPRNAGNTQRINSTSDAGIQSAIKPGEYAVEPMQK